MAMAKGRLRGQGKIRELDILIGLVTLDMSSS